jgi:hypothetical protein
LTVKVSADLAALIPPNARAAFEFYRAKGLTAAQAAGPPGNFWAESGIQPDINQIGGGPGRGIAQWGDPGRWSTFLAMYGAPTGNNDVDLEHELEFSWWELTHTYAGALALLRLAGTPALAAAIICAHYEMPLEQPQPERGVFAQVIYDAYADIAPPMPPTPKPTPSPKVEVPEMVIVQVGSPSGGYVLIRENSVTVIDNTADLAALKTVVPQATAPISQAFMDILAKA